MSSPVFLFPLAEDPGPAALGPAAPGLDPALAALAEPMGLVPAAGRRLPWVFKIQLSEPGRPPAMPAPWIRSLAGAMAAGAGSFVCDTLSITTRGLDTPQALAAQAAAQGFGSGAGGPPFVVADGSQFANAGAGAGLADPAPEGNPFVLAAGLRPAQALVVLTSVRPHPHLGFPGAVSSLGLGLAERQAKLRLHRGLRPRVDTPLCAGCGSCLDVCLFDAIAIRGGRAVIDHRRCTGCGECMNVCFRRGYLRKRPGASPFSSRTWPRRRPRRVPPSPGPRGISTS